MPDGADNPNRMKPQALPASGRGKRARRRRSLGAMALEPRLMYDAAAVTTVGQIWFTTNRTASNTLQQATGIEHVNADGSQPVELVNATSTGGTDLNSLSGIVVDTAHQKYFVASFDANGNSVILSGNLATGALDPTPVYTLAAGYGTYIGGLQLNVATGELYFAQGAQDSTFSHNAVDPTTGTSLTGIFKISEFGTNLTSADATSVVALPSSELDTPQNFALDFKDNLVFFTDSAGINGQGSGIDKLGIANLTTGAVTFFNATDIALPGVSVNTNTGQLTGIAVDPTDGMLYFTSKDTSHKDQNYVFSAGFTVTGSGDTATATIDTTGPNALKVLYSMGSTGAPVSIALDVPNGVFYVANYTDSPDASKPVSGDIEVGSLDGSQPLTSVFEASNMGVGVTRLSNFFFDPTPTVTAGVTAGDTATFTQNGPAVVADAALGITESSGQDLTGATVQITGGFLTGDMLSVNTGNPNITASYDSATGTLTLSGVDTVANYQSVLDAVTFSSTNPDPTNGHTDIQRTLTWTVNDGLVASNAATSTVAVHAAPTVTAGDTATFFGGGGPVTLDGALSVSDPDGSGTLSSATVQIGAGFTTGDTLNFADQNGIQGVYDASTGTLTLSGTASVATYQAALDSITYSFNPTNGDPTAGGGDTSRTITWTVNNGAASSNAVTSTLDTVHVAPTVGGVSSTATFIAGGPAVAVDSGLTVADVDSNNTLVGATVSIGAGAADGDTLTVDTSGTSITASYDSTTHTLTLSGNDTPANYQRVLDTVAFGSSSADPTNGGADIQRSLTWTVSDGVASTSAASSVAVHTPPTVDAGNATATFIGGGAPVTLDGTLTVGDVDSATLTSATVKIDSGLLAGDTLNFTNQNGITGSYDAVNGVLTLTGTATVAQYQAALNSITYSFSPGGDPTGGGGDTTRTISWTVYDGVANSNAATSTLATVHVAPSVTPDGTAIFTGGGPAVTLDSGLTVSDVDSNGNLAGATVSISSGFIAGDTLNFTNQNGITGTYDAAHGVLTLTGTASLANYQNALDSITYSFSPTNGDPTAGGGNTARTISWVVRDGVADSSPATTALDTVHVPPSIVAGDTATFYGGGAPVTLDASVTVSDPDSYGNLASATVSISSGFVQGDTLAANTSGTNITASYDSNTHILTLTGTASVQDYQKVLGSVTYSFPGNGDPTQGGNTTRTISWMVNDGVAWSSSATSTLSTVNAVHTAPTLSGAGNTELYAKQAPAVAVDPGLTVSDPDSGGMLVGATVSITSGFSSGDILTAVTSNTKITASYDAATGVLTLTGQDTLENYQRVLDQVTYSSTDNNPSQGNKDPTRTITWVVDDGAANHNLSTPVTSTIDIVPSLQSAGQKPPHGPHAASVQTAALTLPSLSSDTTLVTSVASTDGDGGDGTNVVPWPGAEQRNGGEAHAAVDLRHAVTASDAALLAAHDRAAGERNRGEAAAAGKPGLLTQLKAAGRQGFVAERQALLKSLQQQRPAAR